jgi:hypothetical protein
MATDPIEEIKQLYFTTSRERIQQDFARAIDLLRAMPTDEERERAAVYLDGLAEMRVEWGQTGRKGKPPVTRAQRPPPRRR